MIVTSIVKDNAAPADLFLLKVFRGLHADNPCPWKHTCSIRFTVRMQQSTVQHSSQCNSQDVYKELNLLNVQFVFTINELHVII